MGKCDTALGFFVFFLALAVPLSAICEPDEIEEQPGKDILDEAPKIVLHDMFTDRVCIHENTMYTSGARVMMFGKEYECVNMRPNMFGDDTEEARWQMEWVPINNP